MAQTNFKRENVLDLLLVGKPEIPASYSPPRGRECVYAANLLRSHPFSAALLELALSMLGSESRLAFIDFLRENGGFATEAEYQAARRNPEDCGAMAGMVCGELARGNLDIPLPDLREDLAGRIMEQHGSAEDSEDQEDAERASRMGGLADLFHLDGEDIVILDFLYCVSDACYRRFGALTENMNFHEYLSLVSCAAGIPFPRVKKALGARGRLFCSGVIEEIDPADRYGGCITLDDTIAEYLSGFSDATLLDSFVERCDGSPFDLASFPVDPAGVQILKALLASPHPCSILLYGIAGTGKSEFARSLVAACGKEALFLKHGKRERSGKCGFSDNPLERMKSLTVVSGLLEGSGSVLVVDEADFLLNTHAREDSGRRGLEKGVLNHFLDGSRQKILWISNEVGSMEESTLRRFSYSLYFKTFSEKERENVWNTLLADHPLGGYFSKDMISALSADFRVNAGGIGSTLSAVTSIASYLHFDAGCGELVEPLIRDILKRHEDLIHGTFDKSKKRETRGLADTYDVNMLNIDADRDLFLSMIRTFTGRLKCDRKSAGPGMNLLFWGPPGTGKTEFVKYLSRVTGLPLIIRRYSDIESPFVGVAEQNISRSFKEAGDRPSILFLDEADSFFTERSGANRSWEISRTNELLSQMESHAGIFVCCTNLLQNMDRAVLRRFSWKIEFRPLRDCDKVALYRASFAPGQEVTPGHEDRIRRIPDLTHGDIETIRRRYMFAGAADMTHERIIGELEAEAAYKRDRGCGRIGF